MVRRRGLAATIAIVATTLVIVPSASAASAPSWHATESTIPDGQGRGLNWTGVTCPSTSYCVAAQQYTPSSGATVRRVVVRAKGTWHTRNVPAPNDAGGPIPPTMSGIACLEPGACIASGNYYSSITNSDEGYFALLNGTTWTVSRAPAPSDAPSTNDGVELNAISCAKATYCVAVGSYLSQTRHDTQTGLIERWNGKDWLASRAPTPSGAAGKGPNDLTGVACAPKTKRCVIAGTGGKTAFTPYLIRGTAASTVALPSGHKGTAVIQSVACAQVCAAVGDYHVAHNYMRAFVSASTSGTAWKTRQAPLPKGYRSPNPAAVLNSVSCSEKHCTAVGTYDTAKAATGLVSRLSGTTWAGTSVATVGELDSVACVAPSACTAVGLKGGTDMFATMSKGKWATKHAPLPGDASATKAATFAYVACARVTSCAAVGSYTDANGDRQGLLEFQG